MARHHEKYYSYALIVSIIIITFLWALQGQREALHETGNKISHRIKRQTGVFQNIFGLFQNVHECCVVPQVLTDKVIQKCGGSPQTYTYAGQQVQAAPRKAVIPINRVGNVLQRGIGNLGNGLFGAFRQFLAFGRGRRQIEGSETTADPGVTPVDPNSSVDPGVSSVDPGISSVDPGISSVDPGITTADTAVTTDTLAVDTFTPVVSSVNTDTTNSPDTGGSASPTPGLQKFGVQSVCLTDCVFKNLNLLSVSNNIRQDDAVASFKSTLKTVIKNATQLEGWSNIVSNASSQCYGPTSKATPAKITLDNGRICSTRPVIYMSCIRRYMIQNCPKININQTCTLGLQALGRVNLFNLAG